MSPSHRNEQWSHSRNRNAMHTDTASCSFAGNSFCWGRKPMHNFDHAYHLDWVQIGIGVLHLIIPESITIRLTRLVDNKVATLLPPLDRVIIMSSFPWKLMNMSTNAYGSKWFQKKRFEHTYTKQIEHNRLNLHALKLPRANQPQQTSNQTLNESLLPYLSPDKQDVLVDRIELFLKRRRLI